MCRRRSKQDLDTVRSLVHHRQVERDGGDFHRAAGAAGVRRYLGPSERSCAGAGEDEKLPLKLGLVTPATTTMPTPLPPGTTRAELRVAVTVLFMREMDCRGSPAEPRKVPAATATYCDLEFGDAG